MVDSTYFDQFDDELRTMHELMDDGSIGLTDESLRVPISTLNLKPAVVVQSGTPVEDCIGTMVARHFGCLLVVEDEQVCGIFTERDALLRLVEHANAFEKLTINDIMTPDPASLSATDTLETALKTMNQGGYRHLAVVDSLNKPTAVLSVKDIVSYIIDFFPEDVLNLPPHPLRLGTKHQHGA